MSLILSQGLLAASLLLGQPGGATQAPPAVPPLPVLPVQGEIIPVQGTAPAPPALQSSQPQPTQPASRPILGFFNREDRPILSRIQGWFKRDDSQQPPNQPSRGAVIRETPAPPLNAAPVAPPPPVDFPRRMPNPTSQAATPADSLAKDAASKEIQQASLQQTAAPKSGKSPILAQLANKIGRDEKFEWITGQFEIENGNFVLYYATPETVDKYNGRIVLLPEKADLKQFHRGDLVSVRGQVSQRQTLQGVVAIYHVTLASLIDRPKQ